MDKSSARVSKESLSEELMEFGFVSEEGAGDVDSFTSHDDDPLAYMAIEIPARRLLAM